MTIISNPLANARADLAAGRAIVLDNGDTGALLLAAERANTSAVAFVVRYSTGFLCVALEEARCDALGLPPMHPGGTYAVTVDPSAPAPGSPGAIEPAGSGAWRTQAQPRRTSPGPDTWYRCGFPRMTCRASRARP